MDHDSLVDECRKKILVGHCLLDRLSTFTNSEISGVEKLKTKIKREISFLNKVELSSGLKKEHISCTNLNHFQALVNCILSADDCVSVLEGFHYSDENGETKRLCVDVVFEGKRKWMKVIARNPKALTLISRGEGEFGQKSIIDQAVEYVKCADQNHFLYKPPKVEFNFACGIEGDLARELVDTGISVGGNIIDWEAEGDCGIDFSGLVPTRISEKQSDERDENICLNLDVSTMIVYVSALTNGHNDRKLRSKVLSQQAEWEKVRPVKPILDKLFEGRKLFACESAVRSFKSIVAILGGEGEKRRAESLLSCVTVVPDTICRSLRVGGHIKEKSMAVFGTGLAIKAITVTANGGFVRAASKQGLHLDVFIHESRALTEKNELQQ